jgi:hypothetical protein
MKAIMLQCPTCGKTKRQKIPKEIVDKRNQSKKGIVTILIPQNSICPHLFLVYMDQNFKIRDTSAVVGAKSIPKEAINIKNIDDLLKSLEPDKIKSILDRL